MHRELEQGQRHQHTSEGDCISCRAGTRTYTYLVVIGPPADEQLPVCWSSGEIERAWVHQHRTAVPLVETCKFRKADIVANGNANLAPGSVQHAEVVAWGERLRLLEGNLTGHVDIKEVHLAVLSLGGGRREGQ